MPKKNDSMTKTILVVEDRTNWRTTFCNLLTNLGYQVMEAKCGNEFREKAENVDVIILDISMPMEPNGEEIKTAGLDVLIELQQKYPEHPAIQNPIVRSMWEVDDFFGPKYKSVNVSDARWCSRNIPSAELLELIEATPGTSG
jgi:CheY-like chemotaxis protein